MKLPALKEIVEERKGKAIENLSVSFAKNRLPLEEYERLVEYINKIESERELIVIEKIVAEYDGNDESKRSAGMAQDGASHEHSERSPDNSYDDDEPDYSYSPTGSNLTILTTRTISGPVKSGSQFVSILGSGRIIIRKADLAARKTVLNVVSILGDYIIFVEPGIRVSNNAVPILGSARVDHRVKKEAQHDGKELKISGMSLLGDIKVKLLRE